MALPCKIKVKRGYAVRRTLCVQKPFGQKKPSVSDDLFCLNPCEALLVLKKTAAPSEERFAFRSPSGRRSLRLQIDSYVLLLCEALLKTAGFLLSVSSSEKHSFSSAKLLHSSLLVLHLRSTASHRRSL